MLAYPGRIGQSVGHRIPLISGGNVRRQLRELLIRNSKVAVCLDQFVAPAVQDRLSVRGLKVLQEIVVKEIRICITVCLGILLIPFQDLCKHGADLVRGHRDPAVCLHNGKNVIRQDGPCLRSLEICQKILPQIGVVRLRMFRRVLPVAFQKTRNQSVHIIRRGSDLNAVHHIAQTQTGHLRKIQLYPAQIDHVGQIHSASVRTYQI